MNVIGKGGWGFLSLLVVLPLAAGGSAQDPDLGSPMPRARATLDELVQDGKALGLVAVVTRKGHVVLEYVNGKRSSSSEEALTIDSIFRIYSMSKPITAVAALTFLDEGRFELDDPIADYLPELAALKVRGEGDEATVAARTMSVRDVFCHTTGWSYDTPWEAEARRLGNSNPDLAARVEALGSLPLEFQPGTRWRYGISSDVLGRLVEVLADKPLDQVFHDRIFKPLGMGDTGFVVPEQELPRLAQLSVMVGGKLKPSGRGAAIPPGSAPAFLSGGGGLYSTVGDYLLFLNMLRSGGALHGVRILNASTVELMTRDHLGDRPGEVLLAGRGYGLGVAVVTKRNRMLGKEGTWSWGGAAGTSFWVDPANDVIAVFMNQTWLDMGPRMRFQFAAAADIANWTDRDPEETEDD